MCGLLTLNAYYVNSSYQIWVRLFLYTRNLWRTFQSGFWVQYNHLNLFSRVVISQRLFCSQKAGMKRRLKFSGIRKELKKCYYSWKNMKIVTIKSKTEYKIPLTFILTVLKNLSKHLIPASVSKLGSSSRILDLKKS